MADSVAYDWPPEWLPIREAAAVSGYVRSTLEGAVRRGAVRTKWGPLPRDRVQGPNRIHYVHMPSLTEYRRRTKEYRRGQPHPGRKLKSETRLGLLLQRLRLRQSWTQEQVAEALNVDRRSVSRWENGAIVPTISTVVQLCELYDLDLPSRWQLVEEVAKAELARRR